MKKSIILLGILIVPIITMISSCTRLSVPVPSSTCIQVILSSAAGTTAQTVAVNNPITPISYAVSGSITADTTAIDTLNVSVLGTLPPGVTGNFSGGIFTLSGTPTSLVGSPFTYTVTTTGSSCNSGTLTGSITVVNSANCSTITLSSAPATASQTLNMGTAITPITYAIGGGATGATVIGVPSGVTSSFAGGVFTISGSAISGGVYTYTVTTVGGACTSTATGTIHPVPASTIVLASAIPTTAQAVCNGGAITSIVYTTGGGATGAVLTGAPAGMTGSSIGEVFTITGSPTESGVFTYTVTTTGGLIGTASLTGTITVNALPTITLTSAPATAAQTLSVNTGITSIVYTVGGSATGVIVVGLPAGTSGTLESTVFTITGTPTASGPFTYTVTTTGGSCSNSSLTGTIVVNP